jgi:hypothetical protein
MVRWRKARPPPMVGCLWGAGEMPGFRQVWIVDGALAQCQASVLMPRDKPGPWPSCSGNLLGVHLGRFDPKNDFFNGKSKERSRYGEVFMTPCIWCRL